MNHLNFGSILEYLPYLLQGAVVTVQLSVAAMVVASIVGTAIGMGRSYGGRGLNAVLGLAVDCLRSIPQLALMVWVFYALPVLAGAQISPFTAGVISLGIQYAAFMSEVVRAGLGSLASGQQAAAMALGMNRWQVLRRVLVPQAVIRMLPAAGSLLVSLVKDTSLVFGIGVLELMHQAATVNGLVPRPFEIFTVVGAIYLVMTYPITVTINLIYRRRAASIVS